MIKGVLIKMDGLTCAVGGDGAYRLSAEAFEVLGGITFSIGFKVTGTGISEYSLHSLTQIKIDMRKLW